MRIAKAAYFIHAIQGNSLVRSGAALADAGAGSGLLGREGPAGVAAGIRDDQNFMACPNPIGSFSATGGVVGGVLPIGPIKPGGHPKVDVAALGCGGKNWFHGQGSAGMADVVVIPAMPGKPSVMGQLGGQLGGQLVPKGIR